MKDKSENVQLPNCKYQYGDLLPGNAYWTKNENIAQLRFLANGRVVFNKIISRNGVQELVRVFRFDHAEKRLAHRLPDELQPIKSLFAECNNSLLDRFVSSCNLPLMNSFNVSWLLSVLIIYTWEI